MEPPVKAYFKTTDPTLNGREVPLSWACNLSIGDTFQSGGPIIVKYKVTTIEDVKKDKKMYIYVQEVE